MEKNNGVIMHKLFNITFLIMTISIITATVGMLIDGIVIGNCLGAQSMAAYGLVTPLFIIFAAIGGVFASGNQTLCSGYLSKGNAKGANNVFSLTCIWLAFFSILLVIIVVFFATPITNALGAGKCSNDLFILVKQYIFGLSFGIPAIISVQVFQPLMQLDSDKLRMFISMIAMSFVNIVLDLLNAFIFHWGMFGMALGTSISYYVALFVLFLHFLKKDSFFRFSYKKLDWKDSREIFIMGMPSAVSRLCTTFRTIVLNYTILTVASNIELAAFSIQTSLNTCIGSMVIAIGMTTLILSGIVAGEEDSTSILHLLKTAFRDSVLVVGGVSVAVFIFAPFIVSAFSDGNSQVMVIAIRAVRYYAVSMPLYAINLVYMNYFQGIRRIKAAHVTCILDNFVYVVLSALILANVMGADGIWLAFPVGELCMLITLFIMMRIENGSFPKKMQDLMLLPKNFGVAEEDVLETSINTMEGVVYMSEQAASFCKSHDAGERKSYLIALCIEEMAGNSISYGFSDGKSHNIDLRLVKKGNRFILRLRDDCIQFNPQKQLEICSAQDSVSHIGIRMIYAMAKDVRYTNVMKMNNLIIQM